MALPSYSSVKERVKDKVCGYEFITASSGADVNTNICTGPCFLHAITYRTNASLVIDVYDDPDSNDNQVAAIEGDSISNTIIFDVALEEGLRVVTTDSGAGETRVTVSYIQ